MGLFVTRGHESGQLPEREGQETLMIQVEPYPSSHISKESLVRKLYYAVLIRPSLQAPFCLQAVWKVWLLKNQHRRSSNLAKS